MHPRHVYVHVPFCARRCSYCDFAIAIRRLVPVEEYVSALSSELAVRFGATEGAAEGVRGGGAWELDTLYFGGGTPSRLGGEGVAAAIGAVLRHARLAPGAELTIEANPDDVDAGAVERWVAAGVNRLSLGAQSFSEAALAWMHRSHGAPRIAEAVRTARAGGIGNISLDLIFALPTVLDRSWRDDLARALELEPEHVSLYGLTVEPATPLGRWTARGEVAEAPEERYEEEFLAAHEALGAAGFEHYEVSNFARPGRRSRHNSSYWRGVPYAGLGPAAHEFDGVARRWNVAPYVTWVTRIGTGADPLDDREVLSEENRTAEEVYLGLRTVEGLPLRPGEEAVVAGWLAAGWATLEGGVLRLTPTGWLRLDSLAATLTVARSR